MKIVETAYGLGMVVGYETFRADGSAFMIPAETAEHDKGRVFVELAQPWRWPYWKGNGGKPPAFSFKELKPVTLDMVQPDKETVYLYLFIQKMAALGWSGVSVDDGDDSGWLKSRVCGEGFESQAFDAVCSAAVVDQTWLRFHKGSDKGVVMLVFGNSAEELIADHSCPSNGFEEAVDQVTSELYPY